LQTCTTMPSSHAGFKWLAGTPVICHPAQLKIDFLILMFQICSSFDFLQVKMVTNGSDQKLRNHFWFLPFTDWLYALHIAH
jgi:hypothetical protein